MSQKSLFVLASMLFALTLTGGGSADAAVILAGEKADTKGWQFSTDGFLNAFYVYEDAEARPAGVGFPENKLNLLE